MIDEEVYDYGDPYDMQEDEALSLFRKRARSIIREMGSDLVEKPDSPGIPEEEMEASIAFWAEKVALNALDNFLSERRDEVGKVFEEILHGMEDYVYHRKNPIHEDWLNCQLAAEGEGAVEKFWAQLGLRKKTN